MKGGWVQAEELYVIIIFFLENIVKNALQNPRDLAENPLENPGKNFISLLATLFYYSLVNPSGVIPTFIS